jgi:hypothetical protein
MPSILENAKNLKVIGLAGAVWDYQKYLNIPDKYVTVKIPRIIGRSGIRFEEIDNDAVQKVRELFKKCNGKGIC